MKVTVVVDEAGKVIAAHVPIDPEQGRDSEGSGNIGFLPVEGQEVLDLDVPEDHVPGEPPSDFLDTLQKHKDAAGT